MECVYKISLLIMYMYIICLHDNTMIAFIILLYEVKGCTTLKGKESLEVDDIKDISEIVHAALMELNKLSDDIKEAVVTGKEVESYRKQSSKLQVLYEAANIGNTPLAPQFTEVSSAIKDCVTKLEKLTEYRLKLTVVMDYCKCISKGM